MADDQVALILSFVLFLFPLALIVGISTRRHTSKALTQRKSAMKAAGWQTKPTKRGKDRLYDRYAWHREWPPFELEGCRFSVTGDAEIYLQSYLKRKGQRWYGQHTTTLQIQEGDAPVRWGKDWAQRSAQLPESRSYAQTLKRTQRPGAPSFTREIMHSAGPEYTFAVSELGLLDSNLYQKSHHPWQRWEFPDHYDFALSAEQLQEDALQLVLGIADLCLEARAFTRWLASPLDVLGRPRSIAVQKRLLTELYMHFWQSEEAQAAQQRAAQIEGEVLQRALQIYRLDRQGLLALAEDSEAPESERALALRRSVALIQRARDQAGLEALTSTLWLGDAQIQILCEMLLPRAQPSDQPALWRLFERITYTHPEVALRIFEVLERLGGLDGTQLALLCSSAPAVRERTAQRLAQEKTPAQIADAALKRLPLVLGEGPDAAQTATVEAAPEMSAQHRELSQLTLLRLIAQHGDHTHLSTLQNPSDPLKMALARLSTPAKAALQRTLAQLKERAPAGLRGRSRRVTRRAATSRRRLMRGG